MSNSSDIRHPIWLMMACCFLVIIFNIDFIGTNIILPQVIDSFHTSLIAGQWINNSFAAAVAVSFLIGTRLCMVLGLRSTVIGSLFIYALMCYGCAQSYNLSTMIIYRSLMGLSIGFAYMAILLMVLDIFPEKKKGLAMGMIFGSMGLGMLAGPTISALILEWGSWQSLYLVNIPCAVILICGFWVWVPKQNLKKIPFNLIGMMLCGVATILLFISSNNLSQALFQWYNWLMLIMSILSILMLIQWEKRQRIPMIPVNVFKLPSYLSGLYVRLIGQIYFIVALTAIPLYLHNILGLSMLTVGYAMTLTTAVIVISSPLFGRILDIWGARNVNLLSLVFALAFSVLFLFLHAQHLSHVLFVILLILVGFVTAANFTASSLSPLQDVKLQQQNQALGVVFTFAMFGDVIGLMLFSTIMQRLAYRWVNDMHPFFQQLSLNRSQQHLAMQAVTGIINTSILKKHFNSTQLHQLIPMINQQVLLGLKVVFAFAAVLSAIAIWSNHRTMKENHNPSLSP